MLNEHYQRLTQINHIITSESIDKQIHGIQTQQVSSELSPNAPTDTTAPTNTATDSAPINETKNEPNVPSAPETDNNKVSVANDKNDGKGHIADEPVNMELHIVFLMEHNKVRFKSCSVWCILVVPVFLHAKFLLVKGCV